MVHLQTADGAALLERFHQFLRDHRQPVTRQRDLVAEAVLLSDDHLSVDQIRRALREQGVRVGLATIYRTLDLLVRSGLVRSHDFGQGFRRYEPTGPHAYHHHLVCVRCGRVEEFAHERLERLLPIIADDHGFQPERHRVEIYGVCRECRRRVLG
ncbi:MAG TPA: Fur family transcriptional regulator [Gemmatimonadales bacterium]|nr:Fur family transcriptional regulator [Gemmatimonadales bacterium]